MKLFRIFGLLCLLLSPVLAQDNLDDSLFGGDEDSLFGEELVTEVEQSDVQASDDFLESDKVVIGGRYNLSAQASARNLNPEEDAEALSSGLNDLSATFLSMPVLTPILDFCQGQAGL
ncbi:MAG: hypothetical protein R2880_15435 [Deinococcales bacterium]